MRKVIFVLTWSLVPLGLVMLRPEVVTASAFTPRHWQQEIKQQHGDEFKIQKFVGQRKHLTWNRDQDHDFIDDAIQRRFKFDSDQRVNIIVDLNRQLPSSKIRSMLSKYGGTIRHIGKLLTFVVMDDVPVRNLHHLAALSAVAMVEWQGRIRPQNRVGARAIQARESTTYANQSAEHDGMTGAGVTIAIVDGGIDSTHIAFRDTANPPNRFVGAVDVTTLNPDVETFPSGALVTTLTNMHVNTTRADRDRSAGHGTHMAGIALGAPTPPASSFPSPYPNLAPFSVWCTAPDDGSLIDCGGAAPEAGLLDVKVCVGDNCKWLLEGLEWIGIHQSEYNIRVANVSLAVECDENDNGDDNGNSALAEVVNYLVALGIAVSVAHGNAHAEIDGCHAGSQITWEPGSSSFAMTVGASEDPEALATPPQLTIRRDDDLIYNGAFRGPRSDFREKAPNLLALKPDFVAPSMWVVSANSGSAARVDVDSDNLSAYDDPNDPQKTMQYVSHGGTSVAAAYVAGAAAILIQADPTIDPLSLKDLLRRTADYQIAGRNDPSQCGFPHGAPPPPVPYCGPTFPSVDPDWNAFLGTGVINVHRALHPVPLIPVNVGITGELIWRGMVGRTDIGFPHCDGPPIILGGLCDVRPPGQPWDNSLDITTDTTPQEDVPNTITAAVANFGKAAATVLVNFGVYELTIGNQNAFHHIGTVPLTIPPMASAYAKLPWTPGASSHQCIQVRIQYGLDTNFGNNVTQRNLTVLKLQASAATVRIENPLMSPATIELRAAVREERHRGWICQVSENSFTLDPFEDSPRTVRVIFNAPPGTKPGEQANCDITAYATPNGSKKPVLIGGVTVQRQAMTPKGRTDGVDQ